MEGALNNQAVRSGKTTWRAEVGLTVIVSVKMKRGRQPLPEVTPADDHLTAEAEDLLELALVKLLSLFYTDNPGVRHAVILVNPARGGWQILTPDGDVYNEAVSGSVDQDYESWSLTGAGGKRPKGIIGKLYKFRDVSADPTLLVYMYVFKEQGEVPGVTHSWPISNPEAESDPAVKKARMFATKTPLGKDLSGGNWMTLETTKDMIAHRLVETMAGDVVRAKRRLDGMGSDWVTLVYNPEGEREKRVTEQHWMTDKTRWATEQKIDAGSAAYVCHDLEAFALEAGVVYEHLDLPSPASIALVGQVYQMIESAAAGAAL